MKTIKFTDTVKLVFYGGDETYRESELWIRTQVFDKQLNLKDSEYFVYELEKGYTDGASIPKIFRCIITPYDRRILIPSQPHDGGYQELKKWFKNKGWKRLFEKETPIILKGYVWNKVSGKVIKQVEVKATRKDFDKILKEKMISFGAGIVLRNLVYVAVRIGGYFVIRFNK